MGSGEREVCVHDPGYGDDAVVAADPAALVALDTAGGCRSGAAQRAGTMAVDGAAVDGADARRVGAAEPVRRRRARRTGAEQRR